MLQAKDTDWMNGYRNKVISDMHGEGNGNPLQCACLENPMDRGAWRATVHGVAKSQTQLNTEELMCVCQGVGCGVWSKKENVQFSSVAQSCPTLCNPMLNLCSSFQ